MGNYLFVFVVSASKHRVHTRKLWRMMRRKPRILGGILLDRLVRIFTGSNITHVSVGTHDIVLDITLVGARFWPILGYIPDYPGLCGYFIIPVSRLPDLARFESATGSNSPWPTILKWMQGDPSIHTGDCVEVVTQVLRECGVAIDSCTTPGALVRQLHERGHRYVNLGPV